MKETSIQCSVQIQEQEKSFYITRQKAMSPIRQRWRLSQRGSKNSFCKVQRPRTSIRPTGDKSNVNINRQEHTLLKFLEVNLKLTFQDSRDKQWALQKQFALGTQQSQSSDSNVSKSWRSTLKAPSIISFSITYDSDNTKTTRYHTQTWFIVKVPDKKL